MPVGMVEPDAAVTSAVKVTLAPLTAVVGEAESAVVVETTTGAVAFTVTGRLAEVLPLKLVSPPYTAVIASEPVGRAVVDKVATPEVTVPVPRLVPPL
jgi:hypothetical protein